jgi:hypothetical protein
MANKRYALTKELLSEAGAKRDADAECQFAIDNPRGLSIRVRGGEVAYYVQARTRVRGQKSTVVKRRLGAAGDFTFAQVKKIATEAIFAIKNGRDPDAVIETRLMGGDEKSVAVAVDRAEALKGELWTFETLITQYAQRTKSSKNGGRNEAAKLRLAPSSITELETRLRDRPENAELKKSFVKELRLEDLEEVRDLIEASGSGPSAAAKYADLAKRVLRWGLKQKRRFTGLEPTATWWEALSHEYEMEDRSGRYLTPAQIGMLIALLEAVRPLGGNNNDAVLGALQVSWMIPQRSSALVNMLALGSDRWVPDPAPERIGWRVYMTRGLKTSFGTGLLKDFVPNTDASVVASLKASGAIIFGKNNLVEMSYGLTGSNAHYGQPKNPYDITRVTGGSSSGARASVAARLVPAALGGDTVGSIRVPAALCGVVGYKPTPGRWPGDGVAPISHTLDTAGVLARSVEDCALIDAIVTGAKSDTAPAMQG